MVKRTVALWNGRHIGIESIFTVIDGKQINKELELKQLRIASRNRELFCPCGCGINLILVAGDKGLREQHFRLWNGLNEKECMYVQEGIVSVWSRIAIKCWLDDKLEGDDVETRVPICMVENVGRKYEYSFLSRNNGIAVSYVSDRVNISDEKLDIICSDDNQAKVFHINDISDSGCEGQYPEQLLKIQKRQGYCIFLTVGEKGNYFSSTFKIAFYAKAVDGSWVEIEVAQSNLDDFSFDKNKELILNGSVITKLVESEYEKHEVAVKHKKELIAEETRQRMIELEKRIEEERQREIEQKKREEEARQKRIEQQAYEKKRLEEEQRIKLARERERLQKEKELEELRRAEAKAARERWMRLMKMDFSLLEDRIFDDSGRRWVQCKYCGEKGSVDSFSSYGGRGMINLGTCAKCSEEGKDVIDINMVKSLKRAPRCLRCGSEMIEKIGPYGKFYGCSNYPKCRHTERY